MEFRKCPACGQILERTAEFFYRDKSRTDGLSSGCRECLRSSIRKWQANNPEKSKAIKQRATRLYDRRHAKQKMLANKEYRLKHPWVRLANVRVYLALQKGKIVKPGACEFCGTENTRLLGHHEDYSKPYDVIWLCPSCHYQHHLKKKGALSLMG